MLTIHQLCLYLKLLQVNSLTLLLLSPVSDLLISCLIRLSCSCSSLIIAFMMWCQPLKLGLTLVLVHSRKFRKRQWVITDVMTMISPCRRLSCRLRHFCRTYLSWSCGYGSPLSLGGRRTYDSGGRRTYDSGGRSTCKRTMDNEGIMYKHNNEQTVTP